MRICVHNSAVCVHAKACESSRASRMIIIIIVVIITIIIIVIIVAPLLDGVFLLRARALERVVPQPEARPAFSLLSRSIEWFTSV